MPDPIQSNSNGSYYDPEPLMSPADGCDANTTTCSPPAPASASGVMIEPVVITGDAGKQALLKQYDADQCWSKRGDAALACATVAVGAVGTAITAPTGVGLAIGFSLTTIAAGNCARVISEYQHCVEDNQTKREAAARCEARDGLPLLSVTGDELICLVVK